MPRATPTPRSSSRSLPPLPPRPPAPASSVVLVNGASPCNVYWQVGSSATLDTTTAFQGNLMALTDISLNNGASVIGRLLARNGQISLINNVLDGSLCGTGRTPPPSTATPPGGSGTSGDVPPAGTGRAVSGSRARSRGAARRKGTASVRRVPNEGQSSEACASGFRATVRGHLIERVVFSLDGKRIDSQVNSPFQVFVRAGPGGDTVGARVTFKDATPAKSMTLPYRACAAAVLRPRNRPPQCTGSPTPPAASRPRSVSAEGVRRWQRSSLPVSAALSPPRHGGPAPRRLRANRSWRSCPPTSSGLSQTRFHGESRPSPLDDR